jgi:predicted AlkP superfamily pyrophosphatase or phosphodiesterase
MTSTYYMREAPGWLVDWNDRKLADQYSGKSWTRLLPDTALYEQYAGPDAVEGEWDRKDIVFPHSIRSKPPQRLFYDDLRRTPYADELTLSFALEAMKAHQIGEDAATDILAVGFAGTDIVGHTYGSDSHETMDQLLRLDLALDKLFDEIDSNVGLANTLVILTADHGSQPLVENLQAQGIDAQRANPRILLDAVQQALDQRFPGVKDLLTFSSPDFYLNEQTIGTHKLDRKEIEDIATAALLRTGIVARVYTHGDLAGTSSSTDPFLPLFRNSFYPPRSPHLNVLLKKYVYLSSLVGGTGHGTAYEHDRHVPIVFMGAGVRPGMYDGECGPEDIAPTLALMLGLDFPRESDSRLLTEMLVDATH